MTSSIGFKPCVTTDTQSAKRLEGLGWKRVFHNCAHYLQPPNKPIHPDYIKIFEPTISKLQKDPNQLASKADLIRALLKEGKTRREAIEEMLKRFPKGSKAGIMSQVYTMAKTL